MSKIMHRTVREWGEFPDGDLLITTDKDYRGATIHKDGMYLTFYTARKATSSGVYDSMYIVMEVKEKVNVDDVMAILKKCKLDEYTDIKYYQCICVVRDVSTSKKNMIESIVKKAVEELGFKLLEDCDDSL